MSDTGAINPDTSATYGGGFGWSNPDNAIDGDSGTYAGSSNTTGHLGGTDYLEGRFGSAFSGLPDGTLNGIEVEIRHAQVNVTPPDSVSVSHGQLTDGAGTAQSPGDNKAPFSIAGLPQTITLGGPSDTWNTNLTLADIKAGDIGFHVRYVSNGLNDSIRVYFIRMTVYYTETSTGLPKHLSTLGRLVASSTGGVPQDGHHLFYSVLV